MLSLCLILATFRALAQATYVYVIEKRAEALLGKDNPSASTRIKLCSDYYKILVHPSLISVGSGFLCLALAVLAFHPRVFRV